MEKGKTSLIKGFTSSKDSKFDVMLKIDASTSKVVFEFNKKNNKKGSIRYGTRIYYWKTFIQCIKSI